jgi:hypothetical protein
LQQQQYVLSEEKISAPSILETCSYYLWFCRLFFTDNKQTKASRIGTNDGNQKQKKNNSEKRVRGGGGSSVKGNTHGILTSSSSSLLPSSLFPLFSFFNAGKSLRIHPRGHQVQEQPLQAHKILTRLSTKQETTATAAAHAQGRN